MDWNVRPPPTSSLQTKNFQIQGSYLSQQFTAAGGFSQANASSQNSCTYLGNSQTINFQSSTKNIVANKMPFQATGGPKNVQPIFPKTSVFSNGSVPSQHVLSVAPVSLSNVTVQMTAGSPQNSGLTRNMHISSSVALQGSTVNPMQNVPQTVNPYMAVDSYSNQPLQNCSNSKRTSVYQQANKNNLSPQRLPTLMPYYYNTNVPATSQAGATVPLNSASGHYLNSQQNFSCLVIPLGKNIENQINGPNSSLPIAMQSQNYASDHVNPPPYTVPTHHESRNATQIVPQVANINCSSAYSVPPIQANHGQFLLPQPNANISNENVKIYHSPMSDQTSNSHSAQHGQKPQSVPIARETNEVCSTVYSISGHRAENQLSNESAKSSVDAGESLVNGAQVAGTVLPDEASTPQTSRTLEQEKTLGNGSGNFPENFSKDKCKIMRESLVLDLKKLCELKAAFLKLKAVCSMKHKIYLSSVQNKQTSDLSVRNQDPNPSLLSPCNTNQNQPLPLPCGNQAVQVPSYDATRNQSFSSVSCGSIQVKGGPLLPQMTEHHLMPVLRNMLEGTVDEDMLSDTYVEKGDRHQNRHLDVQDNSSSTPLVSSDGKSENHVNNIDRVSRLSPKVSPTDPTQEPLTYIKNDLGFQQTSTSANNQLEKRSAASGGVLFHHLKMNKDTIESSNKIMTNDLQSSVQNPAASHGSSLSMKKVIKEGSKKIHCSGSTGPVLIQQSRNACLQKSENSIITGSRESVSNTSGSASIPSKIVVAVQEMSTTQKPSITGNYCRVGRTCSLEELETSLALWRKRLPASLNEQLSESTESTVSLSSSDDGVDGKKTQPTLENVPNTLTQNHQTKVTVGSNETTQSSAPSSLGKNLDAVSSNLLKGSEPQIAIVTPLILAKESTQNEVQKNSPSLEKTYPMIEEGSVHSLEELSSIVPDMDNDSCKYSEDLDKHQESAKSMEENGILKTESGTNCSYDLYPGKGSHFPLELKKLKSQLSSGDNFPPEMNTDFSSPGPQKGEKSQTGLELLEPGGTAEVVHNDPELQISSVCTLVQGDALYNSQIASIFDTSPLKSSMKNGTSSEERMPYSQHNKQPGLLKSDSEIDMSASEWNALLPSRDSLTKAIAEKFEDVPGLEMPQSDKTLDETNIRNSEKEKSIYLPEYMPLSGKKLEQNVSCSGCHSTNLASDNQEFSGNKEDLIGTSTADNMCTTKKESALEHIPAEENPHSGSNIETPVTLLDDQLTELSKEFPYGIGDLKTTKELESKDSMTKLTEREDKENTKICGKNTDSSDAIDQIKIIILNSQQMKEVFPEHDQRSSNKPANGEDDQLIDSKDNLTRECISHIKTNQAIDVDSRSIPAETAVKNKKHTYCCLHGWLASVYAMDPCSCMRAKEAVSKQKVDLCSESKTMLKGRPKASDNFKADWLLNDQVQMSTLDPVSNNPSRDQSNKIFKTASGHKETNLQVNEYKPSKVDQEAIPLPFLEKLDSGKAKRTNKQMMKELPFHSATISLKTEPVELDTTHDQAYTREHFSTDQAPCPSSTGDLKMVAARNLGKMESSNKLRTSRLLKSKTDARRHRRIEIKHSTNYERYKIKRDSSETHMIKGPTSRKGLKKQMAMERKLKALGIQHRDTTNSNISSVDLVSGRHENSQHNSVLQSQGHLNRKKWENIKDLKEKYAYRKVERNEATCSEHTQHNSEHTQHNSEHTQHSVKRINLEKYAWKHRSSFLDNNKTPTPEKQRGGPNISKTSSPCKEVLLDAHNRDKWSERSLSDKKACFNRKTSKLSISLQREQKKNYLNRVAFKRTAQKTIRLTSIESSHSKSVWHVKSSSVSGWPEDQKKSSSSSQQPKAEKPQMLEFKMCPDMLFRNSVSEEQTLDVKNLPEKDRTLITAVKSKREDWLNYIPVKRRKPEETEAQADEDIPLDTAIKLLDGNEAFHIPVKDSKSTFQTYRKLHLEKRSRSLDSSPLN